MPKRTNKNKTTISVPAAARRQNPQQQACRAKDRRHRTINTETSPSPSQNPVILCEDIDGLMMIYIGIARRSERRQFISLIISRSRGHTIFEKHDRKADLDSLSTSLISWISSRTAISNRTAILPLLSCCSSDRESFRNSTKIN